MKQRQANATRLKATSGSVMPAWVLTASVTGEITVADIDTSAPPGHAERILAWGRSAAEKRVLIE